MTPQGDAGALVIAARLPNGEFVYNPPGTLVLEAKMALIVLMELEDLKSLRDAVEGNRIH